MSPPAPRHALLVPDLPAARELAPWLERIDARRQYANFGPLVRELESCLGDWIGDVSGHEVHAVTLASGTAALELGLQAMDLAPGSRILVPTLTFPATALAVLRCGHRPVLADVDPDSWVLTPGIARAIACDAVLPVATYGLPQDADAWDGFTSETGRPVLIDAASALGWQPVGRTTPVAFSLHATKPFGCGEGGVLASAEPALAQRVRRLSNFGFEQRQSIAPGTNAKMSEYAAAVALAQLARREALAQRRRWLWDAYRNRLDAITEATGIRRQANPRDVPPSVLCVLLPGVKGDSAANAAGRAASALADAGIETRRWYCPPLHRQAAICDVADVMPTPNGEALGQTLLGLPFHHFLEEPEIAEIVEALHRIALGTH